MKVFFSFVLILIPVMSFAAVYKCGKGATAIVSHPAAPETLYIGGTGHSTKSGITVSFPCYSSISVGSTDGKESVSVIPFGETFQEITYRQIASFFVGAFAAMSFVIASRGDV